MTTTPAPVLAPGDIFQINEARPYRENGKRRTHLRTELAVVTYADDRETRYLVTEVVAEENRPSFAGDPTGGTCLTSAYARYFYLGEWQTVTAGETP